MIILACFTPIFYNLMQLLQHAKQFHHRYRQVFLLFFFLLFITSGESLFDPPHFKFIL